MPILKMKQIKCNAQVLVMVKVTGLQPWSEDAQIKELYKQAISDADIKVRQMIGNNVHCQIVGEPKVLGIFTETD